MRTPILATILLISATATFADENARSYAFYEPVTDAERQMKAPIVDPNAGVEALFWRVHVWDERFGQDFQRVMHHYVRLKIFSDKGKDKAATIDIPFGPKIYITSVSGRTIKPDGTIVELSKDAVRERDVFRAGSFKYKAKSFAMPAAEVGSILEYRWKETVADYSWFYMRLQLQREFPVQKVRYFIKPLDLRDAGITLDLRYRGFHCNLPPLKLENDGFNSLAVEKMPAFEEEPLMPAEENVRPWVLVYYTNDGDRNDPDKFWAKQGKKEYNAIKKNLRTGSELKAAARAAIEGATTVDEKMVRLIRFVRAKVRDFSSRDVTDAERAKLIRQMPSNRERTAEEIYKSGIGRANELNEVLIAVAAEEGLDARPALVASRDDLIFDRRLVDAYFLPYVDVAVRDGASWKMYDVTARLLPPGKLIWQAEGMAALVTDPKEPVFITTPSTPAEDSLTRRAAKLALDATGALEGDIETAWTGHAAYDRRRTFEGEAEARQQERIKEEVLRLYPQAEVTGIKLENAEDPEKPLTMRYHVRIPDYAQRTGKRLLFQPLFFEKGVPPLFTAAERKYDVHFHYGWRDQDKITIQLPAGFQLERAESPGSMDFGPLGGYTLKMSASAEVLIAERDLVFGRESKIAFPKSIYPTLKGTFEELHRRDNTVLSLRQAAAPAVGAGAR